MKGAANVSLTLTNLKKVKVDNLPQIFEQKQFANKFEKLNTIKEKLNILIDKNIEHNSFLPKRISEIMFYLSDYGCEEKSLPNGWKWSPLSKLGSTGTGTTPSTSNDLFYGGDIPFIKPGDMFDGEIDYFNQSLTNEGLANGRSVAKNSILMVCIGGSIGKSAIVDRQVSCNQQINYIQPEINNKFLLYVMKTPYFQRQLRLKAKGTSTPIINKTNWESILIPIPTNDEILKISHNLSFIYNNQAKIMIAMQKIKKIIRNLDKSFFQYV
jgi:type I restriction enzyme S subunit